MARQFRKPGPLGQHFIAAWRDSKGLSDPKLADEMERVAGMSISKQTVGRLAKGEQAYNQHHLEVLAIVFECEPSDLLAGPPPAPIPEEHKWRTEIEALSEPQREEVLEIARVIRRRGQPDSLK